MTVDNIYLTSCTFIHDKSWLVFYGIDNAGLHVVIDVSNIQWKLYIKPADLALYGSRIEHICNDVCFEQCYKNIATEVNTAQTKLMSVTVFSYASYRKLLAFVQSHQISTFTDYCLENLHCYSGIVANMGLPSLYEWYTVDRTLVEIDTLNSSEFPCGKRHVQRYIKTKGFPFKQCPRAFEFQYKVCYMAVMLKELKLDCNIQHPLEVNFLRESQKWKNSSSAPKKFCHKFKQLYTTPISAVSFYDNGTITTFSTRPSLNTTTSRWITVNDEISLLQMVANYLKEFAFDFLVTRDLEREFIPMCERFKKHHLFSQLSALLSKDDRVHPKIVSQQDNLYKQLLSVAQQNQVKLQAIGNGFVQSFGLVVFDMGPLSELNDVDSTIESVNEMKKTCENYSHIDTFIEIVRQSGTNSVASIGDNKMMIPPSVIYTVNYSKTMRKLGLVSCMKSDRQQSPVKGGLVLTPHVTFTFHPVVVLDFTSMYASIIEAFNICQSTRVPDSNLASFTTCLDDWKSALPSDKCGILPDMVSHWKAVKEQANTEIRKIAAKKCLVSLIGQNLSAQRTSPFCSTKVGNIITSYGRNLLEYIKNAVECFKSTLMEKEAEVVYGDTDSIMICLPIAAPSSYCSYLKAKENCQQVECDVDNFVKAANTCQQDYEDIIVLVISQLEEYCKETIKKFWMQNVIHATGQLEYRPLMQLKREGISRCAIHFTQKKQYMHYYRDDRLVVKGLSCIRNDTLPLQKQMEEDIIGLVTGKFLLKNSKGDIQVVSAKELVEVGSGNQTELFIPDKGWSRVWTCFVRQGPLCEKAKVLNIVYNQGENWMMMVDKDGNRLGLPEDVSEKWMITLSVTEYLISKFTSLSMGKFSVSDLIQYKTFNGYDPQVYKYDGIAASLNRNRKDHGMQEALLGCKVPYVRIQRNSTLLTMSGYQDPLLAVRENLDLDISYYLSCLAKKFTDVVKSEQQLEEATSLLSILARESAPTRRHAYLHVEELGKKIYNICQDAHNCKRHMDTQSKENIAAWENVKKYFVVRTVDILNSTKISNKKKPPGYNLAGSEWEDDHLRICHYYVEEKHSYDSEVLLVCQQLADKKFNKIQHK